jgi:hypothetical protein
VQESLRDALLALVEDGKSHYISISAIMAEVDALRETVRGLDPTFSDVMEQKRRASVEKTAPIVQAVIAHYDEIIRRLSSGEIVP